MAAVIFSEHTRIYRTPRGYVGDLDVTWLVDGVEHSDNVIVVRPTVGEVREALVDHVEALT